MKKKATHTKARLQWSIYFWRKLQRRLRYHCKTQPKGAALRIALAIGTSPAQVHRWKDKCGCDHIQEPSFSTGMALLLYLESFPLRRRTYTYEPTHPAFEVTRKKKK